MVTKEVLSQEKKKQIWKNASKYENFSAKWANYMIKRFYCLRLFLHPTKKRRERERANTKLFIYTKYFIQTILAWSRRKKKTKSPNLTVQFWHLRNWATEMKSSQYQVMTHCGFKWLKKNQSFQIFFVRYIWEHKFICLRACVSHTHARSNPIGVIFFSC